MSHFLGEYLRIPSFRQIFLFFRLVRVHNGEISVDSDREKDTGSYCR